MGRIIFVWVVGGPGGTTMGLTRLVWVESALAGALSEGERVLVFQEVLALLLR